MGISKEQRELLQRKQAAARAIMQEIEEIEGVVKAEQQKTYKAITQDVASFKSLYEDALAANKEEIRISGEISGIPGTVSIVVRYGEILNIKRNAKKAKATTTPEAGK